MHADRLKDFLSGHLDSVLKEPNDVLKHPYIDPGSIYSRNLWDWDSYWTSYGLLNLVSDGGRSRGTGDEARVLRHARGSILNFLDLQLEDGYIPMMVTDDSTVLQSTYLNRMHLEGHILNMHKPFLCQHICLVSGYQDDFSWTEGMLDRLENYFSCYRGYYLFKDVGLYVWADDVMIGMDNDPATFGRPRFSTANIFLNSFMVKELRSMARILRANGRAGRAAEYESEAEGLVLAINSQCWDPRDKFFYSADVDVKTRAYDWFHKGLGVFWKSLPIKVRVWSGFLPMMAGFASEEQAKYLVSLHVRDTGTFSSPFGIRTLAKDEKMYDLSATNNPSNWLGPIWGVANYAVFRGLMAYGYRSDAADLCRKTLELLGDDLVRTGTLHEYYSPETGQPVMNGGFLNWNMLALNMVAELDGCPPMDGYAG